ncbi:hypothetical protein BIV57_07835 [Mangrovactinospora gilvigrisea]|uniref:Polymerase nucleotidyl transferase domain-containing protein n=1 Tax=Mangrovactinospora gilvigrisea TaxID=1428644 RepID=A0A1J7BHK7_9ACTN|nr:hypothetical protein BIV57_07835 [Mangrovactinospora gilvigrisea]
MLGSLARGEADGWSDIDLRWTVPAARFAAAVRGLRATLESAGHPVALLRTDPDPTPPERRLLFARFADLPLFWRLDLEMTADGPVRDSLPPADPWSPHASALANAVGAVKAVRRGRTGTARGLLERGAERIGLPKDAGGAAIAAEVARAAPALADYAAEVTALTLHRWDADGS